MERWSKDMKCKKCGKTLSKTAVFCPGCGSEIKNSKTRRDKKEFNKNSVHKLHRWKIVLMIVILLVVGIGTFFIFKGILLRCIY